jgi:hypothetical protein
MYVLTIKERLRKYVQTLGVPDYTFETKCGIAGGTLSNNYEPSGPVLSKILEANPELNPDWLITGAGTMLRHNVKPLKEEKEEYGEVAEPTTIYHLNIKDKDSVTIPASLLQQLQQQITEKDKQIAQLLNILNK